MRYMMVLSDFLLFPFRSNIANNFVPNICLPLPEVTRTVKILDKTCKERGQMTFIHNASAHQ